MHDAPTHAVESSPGTAADGKEPLAAGLKQRHLTMLGLGGVIGAGLFVGSGAGIAVAGPGIVLSYLIAGALAMLVMRMLGEMSAAMPASGAFSVHAERALGRWAGFSVGWLYWFLLVVVLAVEATGAAQIANGWAPAVPQWGWVLIFMIVFTLANLAAVKNFGEFEFWFATLKVTAIVLFLALSLLAVFGVLPDTEPVGLANLTGHGGFLPHGWSGVVSGVLAVVFAFGGLEVVTIAAAESDDPARAVGRAVRSAVWRILFFYVGSMLVIVTLLPWSSMQPGKSPYVAVLDSLGVPGAGQIMNIVVFVALLSALNANLYGSSRMIFSLAERGEAPRALLKVSGGGSPRSGGAESGGGVPRRAVLASVAFGFVSVLLNLKWPDSVFLYMLNAVGAVLLFVWGLIAVSQLRLRPRIARETPEKLTLRMWGFPYLTWASLVAMGGVLILMLTDDTARPQLLWSAGATGLVLLVAGVRALRERRGRR
ncbi:MULTISPECIES: amino acid permease [unclassified Streptomyces]|uniref:amino acid permease n=1 Tax=unclassified Streptomyces TaxID=2593676 RepID=UPI0008812C7B|nr:MULTISPECIES: amino acid permease [unclassified Streptomyces]PBC82417.1 amino acid/polyamine/organocation transporter (APC superfamily) [Streptomyces sp. 2321.6]SDR49767.1 amino acid/polyamine/organocation transporter, APC superfamily [Streptomyces sp. KS_16]SEC57015.1 amino acid/polyamine/organocation transporter, APC superfamily [Streptomyces sp. 2133.1]SEE97806.1 amino acid/polyamine/organocation transporter, APC superfamily [Streptomyces sp. 2112.3]SNC68362.1 aromatic amino acid permeas